MINFLIRQAKVNVSLADYVHARLFIESGGKKSSVSSIDITSTANVNLIEFNSACEVFHAISSKKVVFSLVLTDKSVDTVVIGRGSSVVLPSDHGSTKFVYLYDSQRQSSFVATVTFTVFLHDPPVIDVAEKNINRLNKLGPKRVPNEREMTFLLKRRLNWTKRGPYPATFDYKTEKLLDREMISVYGQSRRDTSPVKSAPLSTLTYKSPTTKESRIASAPKSRKTHMKVGYIGSTWPEESMFQAEKILYRLYLAEERRLKARIETIRHVARTRGSPISVKAMKKERDVKALVNILIEKENEIDKLRRNIIREKALALRVLKERAKSPTAIAKQKRAPKKTRKVSSTSESGIVSSNSSLNHQSVHRSRPLPPTRLRNPGQTYSNQGNSKMYSHLNATCKPDKQDIYESESINSLDTTVLVKKMSDAFSFSKDAEGKKTVPRDYHFEINSDGEDNFSEYSEELDDAMKEFIASKQVIPTTQNSTYSRLQSDSARLVALAQSSIENLSPQTSNLPLPTVTPNELNKRPAINTTSTAKFKRFDGNLYNFAADLDDVKDRMAMLSDKITTIHDPTTTEVSNSSLHFSDIEKIKSFSTNQVDSSQSEKSSIIDEKPRRPVLGSSPVEKALVKSMNHLSSILARLQAHDSLLSASSSPDKSKASAQSK